MMYMSFVYLRTDPEIIKLFSCSTQLSMKYILLINVKMPTFVGILTFISRINTTYVSFRARNDHIFWYFYFYIYQQLIFHARLRNLRTGPEVIRKISSSTH